MKKVQRWIITLLPDLLFAASMICMVRGVWMLLPAAGWIAAGAAMLFAAYVLSKGGDAE